MPIKPMTELILFYTPPADSRFPGMTTGTSILVWITSGLLAIGVGWSRYEKKKTRDKLLAELAAMPADRREKVLSRLRPDLQTEVRQQLMQRSGLS